MKKKRIIENESGFALLTTLLFGLLSLALIVVAFYMVSASARLGGVNKRYSVELDTAKGVSGYVMAQIRADNLTCNSATPGGCLPCNPPSPTPDLETYCSATAKIILNSAICTALGKPASCAGVSAVYLTENNFIDPITPPGAPFPPRYTFYSARITSVNSTGEQAILDFVYKVTD